MKYLQCFFLLLTFISFTGNTFAQNFWQQSNGPNLGSVESLVSNSLGYIFSGSLGQSGSSTGVSRSTDNGDTWTQTSLTDWIWSLAINSGVDIFAGAWGNGVYHSTDNGDNWTHNAISNSDVYSLAINANGYIFAGTFPSGVMRSIDNGDNWTQTSLTDADVSSLAINNGGDIFAGSYNSGAYRSSNNGDNWTTINNGLTNTYINSLAINAAGDIFAGTNSGVFHSNDNGNNWTQIGLANSIVFSLVVDSGGDIFAGTYLAGVFLTTDNGNNWTQTGLINTQVNCLTINVNGYIFAGTSLSGVFRSVQSITAVDDQRNIERANYSLSQNYPNPFNPTTTINYSVKQQSLVTVDVYDILGNKVSTLVNEQKPAGIYEVQFDASNLSSGIYFYKIKAGGFTKIMKMVLVK